MIEPKIVVGPGLQVYRLAMPLKFIFSYRRTISLQELIESHWIISDGFLDKTFRRSSLVQLTKKFIWSSRKKVIKNVKIPLPLSLVNHTRLKAMKSVRRNWDKLWHYYNNSILIIIIHSKYFAVFDWLQSHSNSSKPKWCLPYLKDASNIP